MASDATISTPAQSQQDAAVLTFPSEGTFVQGYNGPGRSIPVRGWISVHRDDRELGVQQARVVLIRPVPDSTGFRHTDLGRISASEVQSCPGSSDIGPAPVFFAFLASVAHEAVDTATSLEYAQSATQRYREEVSSVRAQLERERRDNAAKLDAILEDAHELAEDHDWCSVYDDLLERHGLPAREREYEVEVRATVRVSLTVSARDLEAAREKAEDEDSEITDAIYAMSRQELLSALEEWQTEEA